MKASTGLFVSFSLTSIFGSTRAKYLLVRLGSNDEKMEENTGGNDLMATGDGCITNGGNNPNLPCIFPFSFKGKTFNSCSQMAQMAHSANKWWCSTKVDKYGKHVDGNWGTCDITCFEGFEGCTDSYPTGNPMFWAVFKKNCRKTCSMFAAEGSCWKKWSDYWSDDYGCRNSIHKSRRNELISYYCNKSCGVCGAIVPEMVLNLKAIFHDYATKEVSFVRYMAKPVESLGGYPAGLVTPYPHGGRLVIFDENGRKGLHPHQLHAGGKYRIKTLNSPVENYEWAYFSANKRYIYYDILRPSSNKQKWILRTQDVAGQKFPNICFENAYYTGNYIGLWKKSGTEWLANDNSGRCTWWTIELHFV